MPAAMDSTTNIFRSGLGSIWLASTLSLVMEEDGLHGLNECVLFSHNRKNKRIVVWKEEE